MLGLATSDNLPDCVLGDVQISADLFDPLFLNKIVPSNLRYRFHYQHPPDLHDLLHGGSISGGSILDADFMV